jgi:hypothetical protein
MDSATQQFGKMRVKEFLAVNLKEILLEQEQFRKSK